MAELQQNRYDQLIRRVGGIIGVGSMVSEAIGELFPMIDVENVPPELLALGGTRLAWQSTERPASAGNTSGSELNNPEGSGVIATVTQLAVQTDINTIVNAGTAFTALGGTPVRGVFRDARFGGARETTLTAESVDAATVTSGLTYRSVATVQTTFRDDNGIAVLTPGTGLRVVTNQSNVRMTVSYWWKERSAEPSELQF